MKKIPHLLLLLLFCIAFNSCKKTVENVALPAVFNPSPNYKDGLTLSESFFVALPDNSFIIASKTESYTHLYKAVYLHYDEHFNFIDSTQMEEVYDYSNAVAMGSNVYSAHARAKNASTNWRFNVLQTDYNYKPIQSSVNILSDLNKSYSGYGKPLLVKLQNGTLISGFNTIVSGKIAPCISAFDPTNLTFKWVNDSLLFKPLGNYGNVLRAMGSDGNNLYVVVSYENGNGSPCFLYKLNEFGQLLWTKNLSTNFVKEMLVEQDRIVFYNGNFGIVVDKEGNLLSNAVGPDYNLYPNGNSGYVGLRLTAQQNPSSPSTKQYFAGVAQYNANFELQQLKTFGDGVQNNSVLGKLANGNYVLVMNKYVNNAGEKLLFFKLDQNLNVLTN
ncbi:MAG: hypothetical protein CFE21_04115 [Bacteroidetes bacterium B1(2017)]|nr:MAG: hypothetical protein CFE21_04115 [Bacteroidetes bacterium B1(2017)]